MKLTNVEKISIIGSIVSFAVFALILKSSGLSVSSAVTIQTSVLNSFLSGQQGADQLVGLFLSLLFSLVFLSLSMAFMSAYGYFDDEKRIGMFVGPVNAAVTIVVFQSVTSLFVAAGIFIASAYVVPLANTYAKELKRWKKFRTGSNSIGKAMMVFNVLVAVGVLLAVSSDLAYHQNNFKAELKSTVLSAIDTGSQSNDPVSQQIRLQVEQQIDDTLENVRFFQAYFTWMPLITAFGVWVMLEFLRNLLISNMGGIFTSILIRVKGNVK